MREINWTDEAEEHIARHAVTPAEVEEAVNSQPRYSEPSYGDATKVYGRTDSGRPLAVLLGEALDGRDYVITARTMTSSEQRAFRRRTGR